MCKNIFINEKQKRLLQIFIPYTIIVILGSLVMGVMIIFYYQQNAKNQLQDLIFLRYNNYLDFMSISEKVLITLSFQKISSYSQNFGMINKHLINDDYNFNSLVAWDDRSTERFSQNQKKPNFLLENHYQLKDYCQPIELCKQNQTCIDNYDNYLLQLNYLDDDVQYVKAQFSSWSNALQIDWEDLAIEQKQYMIKANLQQIFWQTYFINQNQDIIQTVRIYSVRQLDGLFYQVFSESVITAISVLNNTQFGGPFTCTKVNGSYPEYIYRSTDQFDGFLYKDHTLKPCGNSTSPCSCPYFNQKRLLPLDWRCRPWYQDANNSFYNQFSQPYIDYGMHTIALTSTFKVVRPQNQKISIQDELNYQQDGVQAIDLNLQNIQIRFLQNYDDEEYSYLISTNPSKNSTDYIPSIMAHPRMNISIQQNIYDIEFQNEEYMNYEKQMYENQTSFLRDEFTIGNSCKQLFQANLSEIRTIIKNNQQYLTRFTPIFICYGDFNEQYNNKVAYYVKSISYRKKDQNIQEVSQMMEIMVKTIFIFMFLVIVFIILVFFVLLKYFLKHNFEIPIAIVSKVIQEADCESIYILNTKIEKGELKTSLELKNLIITINKVILKFQEKVDKKLQNKEDNLNQIQKKYFKSINTFYAFSHKTGLGMCLNNLSVLYMLQKSYKKAFYYMNLANNISNQIFEEYTQSLIKENNLSIFQAIQFIHSQQQSEQKLNFLQIYSCRKFQLANILYLYLKQSNKQVYKIQETQDLSPIAAQNNYFQTKRQTTIDLNQTNYTKISFCGVQTRESFHLNKHFVDELDQVNEINKLDDSNILNNDEKQALVQFSKQLIKEGNMIFSIISQTKTINENIRNKFILYKALSLLLSIKIQLLEENHLKRIIIKELFYLMKKLVFTNYKNQLDYYKQLQIILQQKYYYYKALFYYKIFKYKKALRLIIKSLNYKQITYVNKYYETISVNQSSAQFYDSQVAYKALKLLKNIIKVANIKLLSKQQTLIKQDMHVLKQMSLSTQKNQLHFFEVFFESNYQEK
ncbi:transmembrane protein, putative (macronuclear) [Tetrahymena thermophila SB210]|uniref:Transmembrane protein, putative n=1 Tax=Tetrahymena thermophila (strain SB210) TaxID=312017 RepID=Q22DS0_TETTS|nr:transmembrane protein, putative [Tetrahymena thermophila SB210]EAR83485.2 transmembrane protein, putative [Tetrahymena thermophila SB210]|eukprot:XP_001031148.2 transmembrane protein, putative [Tetrahymena thermophila SB210]